MMKLCRSATGFFSAAYITCLHAAHQVDQKKGHPVVRVA
jgi:hypothetical protein